MAAVVGDLTGKVGVVTGAGSGIGREVALLAAARGATVYGLDVSLAGLSESEALAVDLDGRFLSAHCDVSDEASVREALQPIVAATGVDFLANCAGIEDIGLSLPEIPVAHWDRLMGINLRGTFLTMSAVLPSMRDRRSGAIVNMGSVAALSGFRELGAYVSSKHGIIGLTKAAVAEFAQFGVRSNVVCPGPIDTPLQDRAEAVAVDPRAFRARQEQAIPQGRYGKPKEVADLILFLVSDDAQYINGATIAIDGGMTSTR